MKEINMYVRGSSSDKGYCCAVILEYNNNRKIIVYKNIEGSVNRAILVGFLNGIAQLKEPCLINAYYHCSIGIIGRTTALTKGANLDVKNKLIELITERGHVCNLKVSSVMQEYMIELLRKTKNFKQNVIYLKDTQSSG